MKYAQSQKDGRPKSIKSLSEQEHKGPMMVINANTWMVLIRNKITENQRK